MRHVAGSSLPGEACMHAVPCTCMCTIVFVDVRRVYSWCFAMHGWYKCKFGSAERMALVYRNWGRTRQRPAASCTLSALQNMHKLVSVLVQNHPQTGRQAAADCVKADADFRAQGHSLASSLLPAASLAAPFAAAAAAAGGGGGG